MVKVKTKIAKPMGVIKSPSDTTIYAPGLLKSPAKNTERDIMIDKISNFVEEMWLQNEGKTGTRSRESDVSDNVPKTGEEPNDPASTSDARALASKLVLEAEQYKANVEQPQGMSNQNVPVGKMGTQLTDNDFFHLVCHVDANMRQKIKKGQFVDLEKLLPHDKLKRVSSKSCFHV